MIAGSSLSTENTQLTVLTPRLGRAVRRSLFWVGSGLFLLLLVVVSAVLTGSAAETTRLDPASAAPQGSKAVAEVLREQGVDVVEASTLPEAEAAVDEPMSTTVVVYDPQEFLNDRKLRTTAALAGDVIVIDPTFDQLQVMAPGVAQAGAADDSLDAGCSLPASEKAGTVSGENSGYRVVDDSDVSARCLTSGTGVFSLIQVTTESRTVTVLGTPDALSNEHVVDSGNAALALNLLGAEGRLVWYLPTVADLPASTKSLAELTPLWVVPVLVLLVLTFVAAAVWRGRRFGPLVVENLPVTVKSNETMLGRARLYERSATRLRAVDALRIGTVRRLTTLCGLPRVATVDEVVAAVAAVTGTDLGDIRPLLVDQEPVTDRQLISMSDALLTLERDVQRAVTP